MSEASATLVARYDRVTADLESSAVTRLDAALENSYSQLETQLLTTYPAIGANDSLLATQRALLIQSELKDLLSFVNPNNRAEYEREFQQLLQTSSQNGTTLAEELLALSEGESFVKATATVPIEAVAFAARDSVSRLSKHTEEFRNRATGLIQLGLIQGWGVQRVAREMRNQLGITKGQAERIVRTETLNATDNATRFTYKQNGIEYVQRIATQDERVCGFCAARAGQVYPIEQAPAVIHPYDRCYNLPWKPEWEQNGLIDNAWIIRHAQDCQKKTPDQINYGAAPFERAGGLAPLKPVWIPGKGYQDPEVQQQGYSSALAGLVASLLPQKSDALPLPFPVPEEKTNQALKNLVIGSAIVGVSLTAYYFAKERYRQGIKESVRIAKNMVPDLEAELKDLDLSDKGGITFIVGGFFGRKGKGSTVLNGVFKAIFPKDDYQVAFEYPEFDTEVPIENDPTGIFHASRAVSKMISTAIVSGRNPAAVRLAATAAAYYKKYGIPANFIGYSSGGKIIEEAILLCNEMDIPVKGLSFGSPGFGFIEANLSPGQYINLMGAGDILRSFLPINTIEISDVKSHDLNEYFSSDQAILEVYKHFGLLERLERQQFRQEQETEQQRQEKLKRAEQQRQNLLDEFLIDIWDETPAPLPGIEPLLASPEGQEARKVLRGELPRLALPPALIPLDLTETEHRELEKRIADNVYKLALQQSQSEERAYARLAEGRIRQRIAEINQQALPPQPKLQALRKAVYEEIQPIANASKNIKPPGASDEEEMHSFRFAGVNWHGSGDLKESSRDLDLLRQFAGLDLPPELTRNLKNIYLTRQQNAYERFWRKKLKLPTAKVPATVNLEDGSVSFYSGQAKKDELLRQMAYLKAYQEWGSLAPPKNSEYWQAMQKERATTGYGLTGAAQDFADSVKEFFVSPDHLKRFSPARYEAIARMLKYRHPEKPKPVAPPPESRPDTRSPQIVSDVRIQTEQVSKSIQKASQQAEVLAAKQRTTAKARKAIADGQQAIAKFQGKQESALEQARIQSQRIEEANREVEALETNYRRIADPLGVPYFDNAPQQIKALQKQAKSIDREIRALEKSGADAAAVRSKAQKLQALLSDLTTRRDTLKSDGKSKQVQQEIDGLTRSFDEAQQSLIEADRSPERSQALRGLQRIREQIGDLSVVSPQELHRRDLAPRIQELEQLASSLEEVQRRASNSRSQLADLQRRVQKLPTRVDQLDSSKRQQYEQSLALRQTQGKLPKKVNNYRLLRQNYSDRLNTKRQEQQKLADDYVLQRQSASNNMASKVERNLQIIERNLIALRTYPPRVVALLIDSKQWEAGEIPSDLAIVYEGQSDSPKNRLRKEAERVSKLIGQINGTITALEKDLDYPNEVSRQTLQRAEQFATEWQQIRDAAATEGSTSDARLKRLLEKPETTSVADLLQYSQKILNDLETWNQEYVRILLDDEEADPATIISQSETYSRARNAFQEELTAARAEIAQWIEEGLADSAAIKQRAESDLSQPLIYEIDGKARTAEELQAQLTELRARVKQDFLTFAQPSQEPEFALTEEGQAEAAERQTVSEREQRRRQQIESDSRLQTLRRELAENTRELQRRREAAERGATAKERRFGQRTARLEAKRRQLQSDIQIRLEELSDEN
ncbi:MAG: minor capsid protein [Kastovskya adunca ATA6-11-RM4]|jgi:SPP1 gp7 family putative phage head morphogenesis protein|nr:minor capsid protein [Kastovskya adunca ATA6-11-RM4]